MTPAQIELARHTLGLPNRNKLSYRNHFVAGKGHSSQANWEAMVEAGMAKVKRDYALYGGADVFWLTRSGANEALQKGERLCPEDFPKEQKT